MKHSTDILIIGSGIIGCSIAYFLRKQGRDVTVLDVFRKMKMFLESV